MADTPDHDEPSRTVNAVSTACEIIDRLQARNGAGVTELATDIDVSKSTIHAQLATLREQELVRKENDEYRLSLKFLDYEHHVRERLRSYDVIANETMRLAEESDEVAQFMTEEHDVGVYLYKHTGEDGVRTASYTGSREYLHCTALGKAILSQYSADRVDRIVQHRGLPAKTAHTITDREALREELNTIREAGIAYDHGEILEGLRCIAKPVIGPQDQVLGAISISGPVSRFDDEARQQALEEMIGHSANVIEINAARVL
jgi:DNA-binding IclR family transcriptional regulator